jgi:hypothetical protein
VARQEALAAAIKTARATAKRGDLIPPLAAQVIAREVRADFKRRNPTARMGLFEEVPADLSGDRRAADNAAVAAGKAAKAAG